ncbi:MAG: GIY-YIG nuclease family protein [Flavobacteriales bacterium]|nr:GIY-YIG nuclease family protein [Flavobacteriales bacterium]
MAKEHLKRRAAFSLASAGTELVRNEPDFRDLRDDPEFKRFVKTQFKRATSILEVQMSNGAGLPMDNEIRYSLREFNYRAFNYGLDKMPSSFNTLEAFFDYDEELLFFKLLEEEHHMLSVFDYVDFVTSGDFKETKDLILDHMVEDLVYHFDITDELEDITFSSDAGDRYVIGGISLVRRGHEVVVLLLTGNAADTDAESKRLAELSFTPAPGKEQFRPDKERVREAVKLFGKTSYWKTLVHCRIDIETGTIDARYVQQDAGDSYITITDDISGMVNSKGEFPDLKHRSTYESMVQRIGLYSSLFELAAKCLYLPYYLDTVEDQITSEDHPTRLAAERGKRFFVRDTKAVPVSMKVFSRTVWVVNKSSEPQSDAIYFTEGDFNIETNGYWKSLQHNALGTDKNGNPIHGRTWVQQTLTWREKDKQTMSISRDAARDWDSQGQANAGHVYLMRNAAHPIDVFKVGRTTRSAAERAKDLSSTSGAVDKFLVANEWWVRDCVAAEALAHERLNKYRVNPGREFFKVDFRTAMSVVDGVVQEVNGGSN